MYQLLINGLINNLSISFISNIWFDDSIGINMFSFFNFIKIDKLKAIFDFIDQLVKNFQIVLMCDDFDLG